MPGPLNGVRVIEMCIKIERLELTQEALRTRTNAQWVKHINEFDVPCAPVLSHRELNND